jgi:hypothetical protein
VRREVASGVVALVATLACACGGSGGSESAPAGEESEAAEPTSDTTADACAALSETEIAASVGNPVLKGAPYAGPEVCKWDTENPDHVSVLLTVRLKGSIREEALCSDLRKPGGEGERLTGPGELAVWKFSGSSLFNSGDLDACGPKGFVSISLNGKADEAKLKEAALTLVGKVMGG